MLEYVCKKGDRLVEKPEVPEWRGSDCSDCTVQNSISHPSRCLATRGTTRSLDREFTNDAASNRQAPKFHTRSVLSSFACAIGTEVPSATHWTPIPPDNCAGS
jgi:hypothetical protein